ncbi:MAG TPA: glycosyltransferase [Acidimicrobiales bacterium]|nr:glycosyltransferase [Acidimicrobiales bacterium]
MFAPNEIDVSARSLSRFRSLIGPQRYRELEVGAAGAKELLAGRTIWNVSSTAAGGGVAEMLQILVGYALGIGIDAKWIVIEGDPEFFSITKRVHNRLHGFPGDDGELGDRETRHYSDVSAKNAEGLVKDAKAGDIVLLHDPQTAGLGGRLEEHGAKVVWRCHVGSDHENRWTEEAWSFLRPHLDLCRGFVFSRRSFAPRWLPEDRTWVIPPSIDPFSPKNRNMTSADVVTTLFDMGIFDERFTSAPSSSRRPRWTRIRSRATVLCDAGPHDVRTPMVVQVSRWDRLKDMQGVMEGFAGHVAGRSNVSLALVGPEVDGVADDPEGRAVLSECVRAWDNLPTEIKRTILIISLPMGDLSDNAVMVNALQRHASVIVQKSLAEGFGLTVAEGMWKGRPVVASAVGGIPDQLTADTGILVQDPYDLDEFGSALSSLLEQPGMITSMGRRARRHVLERFVGDRHLLAYANLMRELVTGAPVSGTRYVEG